MAKRQKKTPSSCDMLFEEDPTAPVEASDSSSDDEDLVYPDTAESDYYVPPSDSDDDEDFEPSRASTSAAGLRRGRSTRRASAPLTQLSHPDASAETEPTTKKQKKVPQKRVSRSGPCRSATAEMREDTERWHDREEKDVRPNCPRFMPARIPGPQIDKCKSWSPLELFQLFFSRSVVSIIIRNTNAHAARRIQGGKKYTWEVLTIKDFYIFLAIVVFTGLVRVPHRADLWKTTFPYNFNFPRDKMSRGRFEAILWSLHISNPDEDEDNDGKRGTDKYDRLFKVKPLYTQMVEACMSFFHPYQNISVDERMVPTKARVSMKQYMKNKPTKWGYKLFVLADSATAYTWNFFVYTGKNVSTTGQGLSYTAVMDLLPFSVLGGGYTVYTDNFYTSPTLFRDLTIRNTGCCGTIRKNRVGFPQTLPNDLPKNADRGDLRWVRRGNLLFLKWKDTREVTMCSSVHEAYSGQTVNRKVKVDGVWQTRAIPVPDAVVDYNRHMGGVDVSDSLVGCYSVRHKTMKWYKSFFYHFMDIAVVNGFIIHKELLKSKTDRTQQNPHTLKTFREQLIAEMLQFAEVPASTPPHAPPSTCMPVFFDSEDSRKRKHCKRCQDAGMPRVKTAIFCRNCQVPLCLTSKKNCFQLWHDGQ